MKTTVIRVLAAAGVVMGVSSLALAQETVYGITGATAGASLIRFQSNNPGGATTIGSITGIGAGLSVRAIDFRPATGELYALATGTGGAYNFYTLNLTTGAATSVGGGTVAAAAWPSRVSIDFNPVVDRIRVVTGNTTANNFRFNPTGGALVLQDGDVTNSFIVGAAYTNNFAGATSTTLYAYDFNLDNIGTIGGIGGVPSPNLGGFTVVGNAGIVTNDGGIGFDISGATGTAFLNYNDGVERFGSVNLGTGAVTSIGAFTGLDVLDISVVIPAPSTAAIFGLGALGLARRRRA